jgi:hypothetical protein
MIYELRTYQLAVGGMADYLDLIRTKLLPLLAEHGIKPVGFWTTDNERQAKWGAWFKDPRRAEIVPRLRAAIVSQSNKILSPTEFSQLK